MTDLGNIYGYLRMDESMYNYPYSYSTHVEYWDNANSARHNNNIMEDL